MTTKAALANFIFWVAAAMVVNVGIWFYYGAQPATEFFGAWAMEKALSLDNLFMFYFIFSVFQTPQHARPRVLRWGIIGVIVMRGLIILGGTALISQFRPLLFVFALFLLWAAAKIFFFEEKEESEEEKQASLEGNWLVKLISKVMPFEKRYDGEKFFTVVNGKRHGTLLLLVLVVIEGTDIPFAFDSLPAAMAISQNFWIVMSSNLLAVLGLRAIYFLIENMRERFSHMQQGIGILLAFAAIKIFLPNLGYLANNTIGLVYADIASVIPPGYGFHIPLWFSVSFIASVIVLTIVYTLFRTRNDAAASA